MKYIVVLGDGMADRPIDALGGKTPLAAAETPAMDSLARKSEIGMVKTVPEGMSPGSDTANLSVLGYDPKVYYSGRSPLEALNIGVRMEQGDIAIRANLVTLSEEEETYEEKHILDHSADEISTEEAEVLLQAVKKELAAVDALIKDGYDFAYIHGEAPDEMGHQGSLEKKLQAIEYLDTRVIQRVKDSMEESGEAYRMLILPDHPTPVSVKTHTADPVPYLLYDSRKQEERDCVYNEAEALRQGNLIQEGYRLIEKLFEE